MGKRQIKKTVVQYAQETPKSPRERSRSRQKQQKAPVAQVQHVDINSRRARLRRAAQQQQQVQWKQPQIGIKIQETLKPTQPLIIQQIPEPIEEQIQERPKIKQQQPVKQQKNIQNDSQSEQDNPRQSILLKPVFISKQLRGQQPPQQQKQQQRRRKQIRYTTKLLLEQAKYPDSQQENQNTDSEQQNRTDIPNDDDEVQQQYEFQLWKIRELKRIRREQDQRRRHEMEKAELQRRRTMTNEQILIQNKQLGSDATDKQVSTKYVFMQKYYSKGAFYQDSQDPIFKRDYNMPTPLQMVDKSMLPLMMQKRAGNFGKKGQSKYTHLTKQDTSDLNPLTRPDQSLLDYWKKKTAGYKGAGNNV